MPDKPSERELTPEEIAANVAKTNAEAEKFLAEAEAARAAADKNHHEARLAAAEVEAEELRLVSARHEAQRAEEKRKKELVTDEYSHVYLFDKEVSESSVKACVQQLTQWERLADDPITVEFVINSPGGSVTDGFALIDFIDGMHARGHSVNTIAYGMAASMAGVLLEVGKTRTMGRNAVLLIHEAQFAAIGSFGRVEDTVRLVEMMHDSILTLFANRAQPINPKTTKAFLKKNWARRDWWISSAESLRLGLCDEVR